jgi:hypothetical protein
VADRPLRPATDRRLGRPLPHQLANRARAPLQAGGPKIPPFNNCHHAVPLRYAVLASLSKRYSPPKGRLPTCYSPVRHSTRGPKPPFAFDLHVLGTPPALILSQDQTLSRVYPDSSSVTPCEGHIEVSSGRGPLRLLPQPFGSLSVVDLDTLYLVFKHRSDCQSKSEDFVAPRG